jgi:DNA helicase II / ATP-dependent DNA helicase PcrA
MFVWSEGDLDPEQEAAVNAEGNVFLIACPGSGKTRTLTYKCAYELSKLQSNKQRVIAITYTHRAADEIQERIEALGVDTEQLWIGTIHSFCLEWILKPYGIYHPALCRGFRVINSHDSEEILTELCAPYQQPRITYYDCNFYFEKGGYVLSCTNQGKHAAIHAILKRYFEILEENRQIDFELMLYYAWQLIDGNPSISILLANMFSCILMDEYQDTKGIQYDIVATILKAGKGKTKTFIVGDPNQSIFKSLGGFPIAAADFAAMTGLDLEELELSKNYRSSAKIVAYFGEFNVHDTTIESAAEHHDYPSLISFDQTTHKDELEDELIRLIRHSVEVKGIPPHEICILAPWWVNLAGMTRKLVSSLPEYEFDGPGMVPFARDIDNFWYKVSRLILTTASPTMYTRRLRWAGEVLKDLEDAGVALPGVSRKSFLRECNSIKCDETDGLKYLVCAFDALFAAFGMDFHSVAVLHEHYEAFFASASVRIKRLQNEGAEFIAEVSNFRKVFETRGGITISTIHGIKGDEYDTVIAYALLDGMVPHFSDPNQDESAMKLLYVISSRARKHLHLISERGRMQWNDEEREATKRLKAYVYLYDVVP